MPETSYEVPKDEHGHDMLSDQERMEHGYAPIASSTDPRSREVREAEALGETPTPTARSARQAPDGPEYSDAIEADAVTRLRAGLPMTPLQAANRKLGEEQAAAAAKEAEAATTAVKAERAKAGPAPEAPRAGPAPAKPSS